MLRGKRKAACFDGTGTLAEMIHFESLNPDPNKNTRNQMVPGILARQKGFELPTFRLGVQSTAVEGVFLTKMGVKPCQ